MNKTIEEAAKSFYAEQDRVMVEMIEKLGLTVPEFQRRAQIISYVTSKQKTLTFDGVDLAVFTEPELSRTGDKFTLLGHYKVFDENVRKLAEKINKKNLDETK